MSTAGFERNVSGVGIALLGTTDMEVTGNQISGNVPSGPTHISGGVVVSTDQPFGGSAKLRNNSVTGNHFGRNKPDIFWDKSGSGNSFVGNLCNRACPAVCATREVPVHQEGPAPAGLSLA